MICIRIFRCPACGGSGLIASGEMWGNYPCPNCVGGKVGLVGWLRLRGGVRRKRVCSLVLSCDAVRVPEADDAKALAARIRVEVAREFVAAISVGPPDLAELPIVINAVLRDWERWAALTAPEGEKGRSER